MEFLAKLNHFIGFITILNHWKSVMLSQYYVFFSKFVLEFIPARHISQPFLIPMMSSPILSVFPR